METRTFKNWIELLCGQELTPAPYAKKLLSQFPSGGLGRSQLNEVLLSVQLDRMGDGLFNFIFEEDSVDDFATFCTKVEKFRTRAAVQFGNFKYAYKYLRHKSFEEIKAAFDLRDDGISDRFRNRHAPVANLNIIEPKDTYYLGYIVDSELEAREHDTEFRDAVSEARRKGSENHDIYLDYDHLDVYIATSMREKIDFWNVARFARNLQKTRV